MTFFNSLFSKKPKEPEFPAVHDFSSIRTDIHSHLIPGIDDGVKTIEESVEMIKGMAALGYTSFITTPHIMSDYFRNTPEIIMEGLALVRDAVQREGLNVSIDAAAEYYIDEAFLPRMKSEKLLTLPGNYVLVEVSYINPPDNLHHILFEMMINGYKPILAHPERYPFWHERFTEYHKLKEIGALFQLNTNSLTGYYGGAAKYIAEKLIDEELIDFLGSDLHGQRHLDSLIRVPQEKHYWKLCAQGKLLNNQL